MTKIPPTYSNLYVLRKPEAEILAARLRDQGYAAKADVSGACSTIDGEHVHLAAVQVTLTPAQAERLAR